MIFVVLLSFCDNIWGSITRTGVVGATTTTWSGKLLLEDPAYERHQLSQYVIIAPIQKGEKKIQLSEKLK